MRLWSCAFLFIVLTGCGRTESRQTSVTSTTRYTIEGPTIIQRNTCTPYAVKRFTNDGMPANMAQDFPIQPGLVSGPGGVYADADCTQLAMINIVMSAGKNTATFYFLSAREGTTVLEAGDVILPKESRGTLSLTIE